jgi:hypothetical protein
MAPGIAPTVNLTPMQQQGPPQGVPNGDMMGGYGGAALLVGQLLCCGLVGLQIAGAQAPAIWQRPASAQIPQRSRAGRCVVTIAAAEITLGMCN